MDEYKLSCLEEEQLLLVVTSTFRNGDCSGNGEVGGVRSGWSRGVLGRRRTQERVCAMQDVLWRAFGSQCSGHSGSLRSFAGLCHSYCHMRVPPFL